MHGLLLCNTWVAHASSCLGLYQAGHLPVVDGSSHGVLLLNSNAMEVAISNDTLSWRVTGGMIDLYVLMGPTPSAVLEQLTNIIGRPALPPLWSLGFHQCK